MGLIGLVIRLLSFIALWFISNPKHVHLQPPLDKTPEIQNENGTSNLLVDGSEQKLRNNS